MGDVVVVVDIGHDIESLDPQVAFAVFQRGDEREAMTVFFSEHDLLQHSVLYFLIKVGVGKAQHQAVGPFLVGHSDFAAHGFVVEAVVETFYMVNLCLVSVLRNTVIAEFRNVVVNVIVVVREILESVDFIQQTVLERLSEVDERFVGVERAVRIRGIGKPTEFPLVGDDIDDPAQGIGTETDGNHPTVDLDAFGEVHRQVVQIEGCSGSFLRYAVDKDLDVFARKTVEHELHVRTHSARLAQLDARNGGQHFGQVLIQSGHTFQVYGHCVECRFVDAAHVAGFHFHFGQFHIFLVHFDIQLLAFAGLESDGTFHRGVPHSLKHQCMFSRIDFQMIDSFFVGACSDRSPFDLYGSKVHDFVRSGEHLA